MLPKLGGCNSTILVVVIKLIVAFCFHCWVLSCFLFAELGIMILLVQLCFCISVGQYDSQNSTFLYSPSPLLPFNLLQDDNNILCGTWETCILFFSQYLVAIEKVSCKLLVDLRYRWNPANKYVCLMSIMISKSCYLQSIRQMVHEKLIIGLES